MGPCREVLSTQTMFDIVWGHKAFEVEGGDWDRYHVVTGYEPVCLTNREGEELPLSFLEDRSVVLASGIGDPSSFYRTVNTLGCHVDSVFEFGDHESFDFGAFATTSEFILTTEKDLARNNACPNVWALKMELRFLKGEQWLAERLGSVLKGESR